MSIILLSLQLMGSAAAIIRPDVPSHMMMDLGTVLHGECIDGFVEFSFKDTAIVYVDGLEQNLRFGTKGEFTRVRVNMDCIDYASVYRRVFR